MKKPDKFLGLKDYLDILGEEVLEVVNYAKRTVTHVTNNSKNISRGSLFIAIKGSESDGHNFISDAVKRGAEIIFHEMAVQVKEKDITYVMVKNAYYAYAVICEKYFDNPTKKLKLIGITGTNGKTTSAYLIRSVLVEAGKKVGLISTVEYSCGETLYSADRTTPEAYELQSLFYEMVQNGCEYAVMEVSSHALSQHRTGNARYEAALFTNLSGDHLDYHKDMDNYFQAKTRLFTECLTHAGSSIINQDDYYGSQLIGILKHTVTYGFGESCAYRVISSKDPFQSCTECIVCNGAFAELKTSLLGRYNAYNVAGVFALCSALGIDKEIIVRALSKKIVVPGRLDRVYCKSDILFFVDYAHTDDALERALCAMRELNPVKLISVFGCGGNRDRTKRPRMGKISADLADLTIVTSDNPRKELPSDIIKDILEGIPAGKNFCVIENRRDAIFEAVKIAESKSVVLIAGKGHEDYQEINGVKHHFSDKKIVAEAITFYGK